MRGLLLAAVLFSISCAGHPVNTTPSSWKVPQDYKRCQVHENIRWPKNQYHPNGVRTVTIVCPERTLLLDWTSKKEVDIDNLDFRPNGKADRSY